MRTSPCPQFLRLILERARGSPIKLSVYVNVHHYEPLFQTLQVVLPDITSLSFWPGSGIKPFIKLYPTLSRLNLPSLASLRIFLSSFSDIESSCAFLDCFLGIANRSDMADQLSLFISCRIESLISAFRRRLIFSKARAITLKPGGYIRYFTGWH
jgi:hypothetical protein